MLDTMPITLMCSGRAASSSLAGDTNQPMDGGAFAFEMDAKVVDGYRKIDNITDAGPRRSSEGVRRPNSHEGRHLLLHLWPAALRRSTATRIAADLKKIAAPHPAGAGPVAFRGGRAGTVGAAPRLRGGRRPTGSSGLDAAPVGDPTEFFRVEKMVFRKRGEREADRTGPTIIYNSRITLTDIPEDAYRYMLGSRSASRVDHRPYQVKTDKASGIVNDPNNWSREVGDPRYIVDLLAGSSTVSLETMKIVDALPALDIRVEQ